VNIHKNILWE